METTLQTYPDDFSFRDAARLDYAQRKKSVLAAYCLLIVFGPLGAHRFYLKRNVTGWIMLGLSITIVGLVVTVLWSLVDLFLVPFMTANANGEIRRYVGA